MGGFLSRELGSSKDDPFFILPRHRWHTICLVGKKQAVAVSGRIRSTFNLETVVGRACWCVWAGVWREATTRQAHACKAERQSQAPAQACQRACSAVTIWVSVGEGTIASVHTALEIAESGQLPFLAACRTFLAIGDNPSAGL